MPILVYSIQDTVSSGAAEALKGLADLKETKPMNGLRCFENKDIKLVEIESHHITADFLDQKLETDCIIILSRHSSAKGLPSFTVHAEGNWNDEAKIGGMPKQLSTAAPVQMLKILAAMKENNRSDIPVTYEATHHGPLLKTPSLYAEVGGTEAARNSKEMMGTLAKSVLDSLTSEKEYDKIAFGIGGLHYSDRFAKLALEGKYAFGHIVSRHGADYTDMFEQAIGRCSPKAEIAVIDWKSIYAEQREKALSKLNELGMDYVRI